MSTTGEDLIGHWIQQEPWKTPKQVIELNARDMSGEDWYTNPHGNESPGRYYQILLQAKHDNRTEYHQPTMVVQLRDSTGAEQVPEDKWTKMDIGRRIAGCLTDLEVMARMDLIRVRVVLQASEGLDERIRPVLFHGIQNDLRQILSDLTPTERSSEKDDDDDDERPRTEYEEIKSIADTVDLFIGIALTAHGLPLPSEIQKPT